MANEILKFGAMIVDQLRDYKHPVFVYIPPRGELRGGAWVVVDPTINEEVMEMYADQASRGGILEPPGICEVKFRAGDQVKLMHRLDPQLKALSADAVGNAAAIVAREEALLPFYTQVAHAFADLHDRAGRMKAKGAIREVLVWEHSRSFFYWRLRRRLAEDAVRKRFREAQSGLGREGVSEALRRLMSSRLGASAGWEDDQAVAKWLEEDAGSVAKLVDEEARSVRVGSVARQLRELDPVAARAALAQAGY